MDEKNYLAEMQRLRTKYPMVTFLSKGKEVTLTNTIRLAVRIRASRDVLAAIEAKIVNPRAKWAKTYVDLFEIERAINAELEEQPEKKQAKNYATKIGKGMISDLGGYADWVTGHYLLGHIPATEDRAFWSGWLRFQEFKGKDPLRRKWNDNNRRKLHAGGHYAWICMVDTTNTRMKLYYSGPGTKRPYATQWFPMVGEDLHRQLVEVSAHADKWKWRDLEIQEVEANERVIGTVGYDAAQKYSPRHLRRLKQRHRELLAEAAELDRFRAAGEAWAKEQLAQAAAELDSVSELDEDDWHDPNAPKNWCGDLSKHYVDEPSEQSKTEP